MEKDNVFMEFEFSSMSEPINVFSNYCMFRKLYFFRIVADLQVINDYLKYCSR